jgi:hypothetical protein
LFELLTLLKKQTTSVPVRSNIYNKLMINAFVFCKWEKPEEFVLYEQQKLILLQQQQQQRNLAMQHLQPPSQNQPPLASIPQVQQGPTPTQMQMKQQQMLMHPQVCNIDCYCPLGVELFPRKWQVVFRPVGFEIDI